MSQNSKGVPKLLQNVILYGLAIAFALAVFLIDMQVSKTVSFGTVYCIVIFYTWLLPHRKSTIIAGFICTALLIIAFLNSPYNNEIGNLVGVNAILSLVALWVCVVLVEAAKKGLNGVQNLLTELEEKVQLRTKELEISRDELWESEKLYKFLYHNSSVMYASSEPINSTLIKCNQTLCKRLGYTEAELIGQHLLKIYHPSVHEKVKALVKVFKETGEIKNQELVLLTKKGKKIDIIANVSAVRSQTGTIRYSRANYVDITPFKIQQRKLLRAGELLKQQNAEMQQFVYIASHDLQEPLRTVTTLTDILAEDYAEHFDEDGKQSLSFINEATGRMRNLIIDLLTYGRIGKDKVLEEVNIQEKVENVKQDLTSMIEESGASINLGDLPTIKGYKIELRQLFQNLLTNSIKFRKQGENPTIDIMAEPEGSGWRFSVKDNGIGIAPEHTEKIFKIFQRLHNRNMYEGTGIGLANCKKIIDLHQGKIWVESELGKGSTFYFFIPKNQVNEEKT